MDTPKSTLPVIDVDQLSTLPDISTLQTPEIPRNRGPELLRDMANDSTTGCNFVQMEPRYATGHNDPSNHPSRNEVPIPQVPDRNPLPPISENNFHRQNPNIDYVQWQPQIPPQQPSATQELQLHYEELKQDYDKLKNNHEELKQDYKNLIKTIAYQAQALANANSSPQHARNTESIVSASKRHRRESQDSEISLNESVDTTAQETSFNESTEVDTTDQSGVIVSGYLCPIYDCTTISMTPENLVEHITTCHDDSGRKRFHCFICTSTFARTSNRNYHLRHFHKNWQDKKISQWKKIL